MKVSPNEFAHTLRSMRASYDVTIDYVENKIKTLEEDDRLCAKLIAKYKAALKVMNANPERFR